MSILTYNGYTMLLIKTNSVTREPRLSDDGTDYMWTVFTIDVNCVYNPRATSYPTVGELPMVTDATIRSGLMQPRCPLFFSEGNIPILNLPVNIPGGTIDCDDGPTPLACHITRIESAKTFMIRYVVRASVYECPQGSYISPIASSRYTRSESLDSQYRSTMTVAGKAYFRSNVLAALQLNADAFRGYIIPQPMAGFARKLVQVAIAPNGIVMEFAATDVEQFIDLGNAYTEGTAASVGITEMDIDYSTSTYTSSEIGFAGLAIRATVSCMAVGTRGANTYNMVVFLLRCIANKLGSIVNTGVPVDVSCRENQFKSIVMLSMTYQTLPPKGQLPDMTLGIKGFVGEPIASLPPLGGVQPQPPFSNQTRGPLAYTLAVNAFAVSCLSTIFDVGGCDQTGMTPPDVSIDGGQCLGQAQVLAYEYIDESPSADYRQAGKQSFRGENPEKQHT